MKNFNNTIQRVAVVEKIKNRSQKKIPLVFTGSLIDFIEIKATRNIVIKNNNGDISTLSLKDFSLIYL